jgi:hypothetical protein
MAVLMKMSKNFWPGKEVIQFSLVRTAQGVREHVGSSKNTNEKKSSPPLEETCFYLPGWELGPKRIRTKRATMGWRKAAIATYCSMQFPLDAWFLFRMPGQVPKTMTTPEYTSL